MVRLAGRDLPGHGEAVEVPQAVAADLMAYLRKAPHAARYFGIASDPDGQLNAAAVAHAAEQHVMVRVRLAE